MNEAEERPSEAPRRAAHVAAGRLAPLLAVVAAVCTPRVEVAPPSEPITINLNIKLDADVRLRVEEKAKQDVETKPIF